jgi:hypothetical protein
MTLEVHTLDTPNMLQGFDIFNTIIRLSKLEEP